jgi:hypothetical protein
MSSWRWDNLKKAPNGHVVHDKELWNNGLHTYVAMVGYCMKARPFSICAP